MLEAPKKLEGDYNYGEIKALPVEEYHKMIGYEWANNLLTACAMDIENITEGFQIWFVPPHKVEEMKTWSRNPATVLNNILDVTAKAVPGLDKATNCLNYTKVHEIVKYAKAYGMK